MITLTKKDTQFTLKRYGEGFVLGKITPNLKNSVFSLGRQTASCFEGEDFTVLMKPPYPVILWKNHPL